MKCCMVEFQRSQLLLLPKEWDSAGNAGKARKSLPTSYYYGNQQMAKELVGDQDRHSLINWLGHFISGHLDLPWWPSQNLLKLGWNDPFCNRNEPWKFQLHIIIRLESIHHWILNNFPALRWLLSQYTFLPTLSENYILTEILFSLKINTSVVFYPN